MKKLLIPFISIWLITIPLFAQETILIQGVELTIEKESEIMKRWRLGNGTFLIKDGQKIPAKKVKAKDYIAPNETKPAQTEEDKDKNGETDFVFVNVKTGEKIK